MSTQEEEGGGYYLPEHVFTDKEGYFTLTNLLNKPLLSIAFSHKGYTGPVPRLKNIDITKELIITLQKEQK
jgi:hypothetical protein